MIIYWVGGYIGILWTFWTLCFLFSVYLFIVIILFFCENDRKKIINKVGIKKAGARNPQKMNAQAKSSGKAAHIKVSSPRKTSFKKRCKRPGKIFA